MRLRLTHTPLLLLFLFALLALPFKANALSAATCHCFTDRSYNPEKPTIADPYFLATTQNSFFAAAFGVEKRSIVMQKQKGAAADDLWIAHWVASRTSATVEDLLQKKGTWKEAIAPLAPSPRKLGPRFFDALNTRHPSAPRLAEAVVDELLLGHKLLEEAELKRLRTAAAGNQEIIIATLLATKTQQPASQILRKAKGPGGSWGELLLRAGIDPSQMQAECAALLKKGNK
jgi:hypothetical protein